MEERAKAMGSNPRVSVVIPTFNVEAYLSECLDSVFRQTFTDYETIVVDDGSTDSTIEVALKYGPRVACLREPHRGSAATRNRGILAARGELVAFLDADDVWLPEYLEKQVETFDRHGGDCLVFCDVYLWDGRDSVNALPLRTSLPFDTADPLLSIVSGSDLPIDGVLVPREMLLTVGLFAEALSEGEEVDLWLRLAAQGTRFRYTAAPLALYRHRPGSLSSARPRATTENHMRELREIGRDERLPLHVRQTAIRRARGMHRRLSWLAGQALLQGQFDEARACWVSAFKLRPWNWSYALGAAVASVAPHAAVRTVLQFRQLRLALRHNRQARS